MRLQGQPLPPLVHRSVNEALAAAARTRYGITFVDLQERELFMPWSEVYQRARRAAASLAALGVQPGDRIPMAVPTGPSFMDAFFGTLLAGAIPAPLSPPLRPKREEYLALAGNAVRASGARLVLAEAPILPLFESVRATLQAPLQLQDIELLPGRSQGELKLPVAEQAVAMLQFSSGSTLLPKAVALTHHNLLAHCAMLKEVMSMGRPVEGAAMASWLPLYHDMGLIMCLLNMLCWPESIVLMRPEHFVTRPALWLRAISRHRVRSVIAPQFAYSLCLSRVSDADMEGVDLSGMCNLMNGAEPIAPEVYRRFAERFSRWGLSASALTPAYGLAEATCAVTVSPIGQGLKTARIASDRLARSGQVVEGRREVPSVGLPLPGMALEVRDEEGRVLPERRAGRVWVSGPTVMSGYYLNPEATERTLQGGWVDTGDIGFLLEGELYIVSRAKDVIILRGANHAPEEFEECFIGMSGVRPGSVVAAGFVPEQGSGEEVLLLLAELTEEAQGQQPALEQQVRSTVQARTGVAVHTVRFLERGALPRTTSGKLRRAEAVRRLLAGELPVLPA